MAIAKHRRKAFRYLPPEGIASEFVFRSPLWALDGSDNVLSTKDRYKIAGGGLGGGLGGGNSPLGIVAGDSNINGHQCAETDGTEYLNTASKVITQPYTIVAVVKDGNVDSTSNSDIIAQSTGGSARIQWRISNNEYRISAGTWLAAPSNSRDANWHYIVCIFDGANSAIRINGSEVASGNAGTGNVEGLSVLARTGLAKVPSGSRVAHVGVFDTNTDDAGLTAGIENYFQTEYGL